MSVYKAVPGIDAVPLADGAVLLRGDLVSCRLEGASAALVAERLLPALDGWQSRDALQALLGDYAPQDVADLLDQLVEAGVVRTRGVHPEGAPSPALEALAMLGMDEQEAGQALASARTGLFGAAGAGLLVAKGLAEAGVGELVVAPAADVAAVAAVGGDTVRVRAAPSQLSRSTVEQLAGELDLMIVTVDRRYLAARHWANRASLATGTPALFADLGLAEALIGPSVLPGETACYMCFRMRHLATYDKFGDVFAHEQYLDGLKDTEASRRLLPGLAEVAAGILIGEALRLLMGPLAPALVDNVLQYDASAAKLERHWVLRQPDCPHCRGIDSRVRRHG